MRKTSTPRAAEENQCVSFRLRFDDQAALLGKEPAQTGPIVCHFDDEFIRELAADPTVLVAVEAPAGPNMLPSAWHIFKG